MAPPRSRRHRHDRHHRPRARRSSATSCSSSCPTVGRKVGAGEACAVVESVKAASDVYAPLAGEIVAVNDAVPSAPEIVNQDAYAAWLFRVKPSDPSALDAMLDARGYQAVIGD